MEENENVNVEAQEETTGTKASFDELLKDKDYQAEFDKRVSKAISTRESNLKEELRKQWELEQNERLTEAEKLAKMNREQKLEYELKKIQSEKERLEAQINANSLKEQTLKIAEEKGLPQSIATLLDFEKTKAEDVENKIDELNETFKRAVEKAVNDRLKEPTPTTKTSTGGKMIKEIPPLI